MTYISITMLAPRPLNVQHIRESTHSLNLSLCVCIAKYDFDSLHHDFLHTSVLRICVHYGRATNSIYKFYITIIFNSVRGHIFMHASTQSTIINKPFYGLPKFHPCTHKKYPAHRRSRTSYANTHAYKLISAFEEEWNEREKKYGRWLWHWHWHMHCIFWIVWVTETIIWHANREEEEEEEKKQRVIGNYANKLDLLKGCKWTNMHSRTCCVICTAECDISTHRERIKSLKCILPYLNWFMLYKC